MGRIMRWLAVAWFKRAEKHYSMAKKASGMYNKIVKQMDESDFIMIKEKLGIL